ncbi:VCBS repeat-containing protein [Jiulongibacter sediminis]|jgi:hypothetical protein|uniref:FG-GAP repeat domain-containing protein n=1 Tax=Jiulongibacter sediminis TaxID=1605367 RepID=UPI0026F1C3E3|nr:VCBS repeat-containing protein [Jiulongibacter sediminis]
MTRVISFLFVLALFINFSCSEIDTDEALAQRTCGGCHLAPTPDMLDKATWREHILPRMGAWLGVEDAGILRMDMTGNSAFNESEATALIPTSPVISDENWVRVQAYYINNAPEKLEVKTQPQAYKDLADIFDFEQVRLKEPSSEAMNTLVSIDEENSRIYAGRRNGFLRTLNTDLEVVDSTFLSSSPVGITPEKEGMKKVLLAGVIRPNNEPLGSLINLVEKPSTKIQGLYRPVFMVNEDLNSDGLEDYIICNFGNHIGKLAWYEATESGDFTEHILMPVSGAIQVELDDINKDGKLDIIALFTQGNESVVSFLNLGRGEFKPQQWLQLPAVYGSTAFAWHDFNNDGNKDIVVACGDNADYSFIEKPYHGVRFFENDGQFHFKEAKFLPLNGASGLELADFDQDGVTDLAVIANYARFSERPQRGFVLYKGLGGFEFEPYLSSQTDCGRYLVFDKGDIDGDGDIDLILGSHMIPLMVGNEEYQKWRKEAVDLLVLRNKTIP